MYYCGLDVAKNKSNACVMDSDKKVITEFAIDHNKEGFERLVSVLPSGTKIALEVTGNYSKSIFAYLSNKYDIVYVNSRQLKSFARLHSPTVKTDKIDARLIALFLLAGHSMVAPPETNELKDLCILYQKTTRQLIRSKCMFKDHLTILFPELEKRIGTKANKGICNLLLRYPTPREISNAIVEDIRSALIGSIKGKGTSMFTLKFAQELKELAQNSIGFSDHPTISFRYSIRIMKFYQELIKELETNIKAKVAQTPYSSMIDKFGYNTISIAMLAAHVGDIRRFPTQKQFVSYCGLGVTQNESGTSVKKKGRITKAGNSQLRHTFYMLTLVHLRYKTEYAEFYRRLVANGKYPKKALVAMSRKLAVRAYYDMLACHKTL